ncbi:isopenicillin N synthase family dioxygenase [Stutzerimonas kirkiae]|uniref:2-oxoglutarate-dependent ethylene/succinate-forming enzyme n=1 Tax=Stutzerimonas kirkiae TaxID=2211392 RepID=A0A4Q9RCG9_9GAMM|nr:2-oxoglutarate and iron-dependent oxygenase domain-containing protein [Stutzerimonas kirkiae]TBU98852.1 isopenicillin N synthase family oxygenase [Stutzerimonas kirkiae]TBV03946.1 isopenicillin N synthase family oxygenase [Stutzerimonas kirkiae]TBV09643.1 isopenicillin N synthase family oxygenase [Stutzerimonas kirkiae]TBV16824.1 isopenicillin N synthase family oxygenase [Stutzerimonas kirkiae]
MPQSFSARAVDTASLPVIDIGDLSSDDPARIAALAERLHRACRDKGFFYVVGHGIDPALQQAVFDHAAEFFALPEAAKAALDKRHSPANRGYEALRGQVLEAGTPPDVKEGFYIGPELDDQHPAVQAGRFNHGANQWPAECPEFSGVMLRYLDEVTGLGERLMGLLALSLGLPREHFADYCREPLTTLRLLHYPPQPAKPQPGEKGCGAHTDFGGLTLLLQDANGGLQVWDANSGEWLVATPIPGSYVVNLGDMIARWTNDRYRSTLHRVVNSSGHERYSVPFFYSGNPDHLVECLPGCLAEGAAPRYPAVTVEEHLREMYQRTYA